MKIRSAKAFRTWYKVHGKKISADSSDYDEHFMGTYYDVSDEKRIKGFFEMYHGHKQDIAGYLPSILKIAEDGQAIYEFLQNAVDCHSSECHIFYNDRFFLAVNNGRPFSVEEVVSLLNIAQSPKKDASQIGRFGVGFKLVHRLVGQGDGANELVNEYKGPILFSWSESEDLWHFLEKEKTEYSDNFQDENLPILFKILLTNFPADMGECVKDISFNDRVVFSAEELAAMQGFMKEGLSGMVSGNHVFSQGSAFFLQLGKGKKELLDRNYKDLVNGIQFSMNILKLSRIKINKQEIIRFPLQTETFAIACGSEAFVRIDPEYKGFPINIIFGYPADISQSERLKQSPNFYKFFPMGDEINGFNFIVHCDSFSNEVNRRKLQHDPVNTNLLPEIARRLILRMDELRESERSRFLSIYGNLLLSDVPDKQNNEWLKPVFYQYLHTYMRKNIPIAGCSHWGKDPQKVKIRDLKINVSLEELGFPEYDWFYWDAKNRAFTEHARDPQKLGLEKWDIRDIIEQSDLALLNQWIAGLKEKDYDSLLRELNKKDELRIATKSRLKEVALFKFSDGNFYSLAHLEQRDDLIFVADNRIVEIKDLLEMSGFVTTCLNVSDYDYIYEAIKEDCFAGENKFFDMLAAKCEKTLFRPDQKIKLIRNLANVSLWPEIHEEKLGALNLFCNKMGDVCLLNTLLSPGVPVPEWLDPYKISEKEYVSELDKFLVPQSEIYTKIIIPNQKRIFEMIVDQSLFCQQLIDYCRQDEKAPKWNAIFVNRETGYVASDCVFYHPGLAGVKRYADLRSAIFSLTGLYIPEPTIVEYLENPPFSLSKTRITEIKLSEEAVLSQLEMEAILDLCHLTSDNFFDEYIIIKKSGAFGLIRRTDENCQIRIAAASRRFIEVYFSREFYILPSQFDNYRDSVKGIVEKDKLYEEIVSRLDADNYKEELTCLFLTENAKRLFLQKLSVLSLDAGRHYADGDCEYTILDWACQLLRTDEEIKEFKSKIVVVSGENEYRLTDIPPVLDKILIGEEELSLSQILPVYYKSIDCINMIAEKFQSLGNRINTIIGIEEQADLEHYYTLLKEEELEVYKDGVARVIENTEQLLFVLLYQEENETEDLFCIYTKDKEYLYYLQSMTYSLVSYDFLRPECIIDTVRYKKLDQHKERLLNYDYNDLKFLEGPLDHRCTVLCDMISEELDDEQRVSLMEYLCSVLKNNPDISVFRWTDEEAKMQILGFDPSEAVYASDEYTHPEEMLPAYLSDWIGLGPGRESILSALGVHCAESALIRLRKALLNETLMDEVEVLSIPDSLLLATLKWFRDSKVAMGGSNRRNLLAKVFDRLKGEVTIEWWYDNLSEKSKEISGRAYEEWTKQTSYRIFLYDGPLVAKVGIKELGNYSFYEEESNVVCLENACLYINRYTDILTALSQFSSNNDFPVKLDELYGVYMSSAEGMQFMINEDERALIEELRELPLEEKQTAIRNLLNHIHAPKGHSEMQQALNRYEQNPGDRAEQFMYDELVARYGANRVKWTSSKNPFNRGRNDTTDEYDFEVYDETLQKVMYYIDCKSTKARKLSGMTDIFWTDSEWRFLEEQRVPNYVVARVFDCYSANPEVTYLHIKCIDMEEL